MIHSRLLSAKPAEGTFEQLPQQSSLLDLPIFTGDSEMHLPTNMISPNPSGVIQMLENIDQALSATEKTIQRFTHGLKSTTLLLQRDLFSAGTVIGSGETAQVYSAVGKPTKDQVFKSVSLQNKPACAQKERTIWKLRLLTPIKEKGWEEEESENRVEIQK